MKYRAFISYSHTDSAIAKRVHRWLEAYKIPKRLVGRTTPLGDVPSRLNPIFRDREELPTSADLGGQIVAALQDSAALIVICSPRSAASRWVNEEILAYKRLGRSAQIFCLLVDGEPNASSKPGHSLEECFAPALRFQLGPDAELSETPAEPIAADMRPGKDGRRNAFLKLAAGLAGVGFDELKQRELQRQLRRAVFVSIMSGILLLTMAGLAISAALSRSEAIRQQAIAVTEKERAEKNFKDAREAVDRFYTKVSQEKLLQAEGLQPLRAELLKEALQYYQGFLAQRQDDPVFAYDAAIVQANVGEILAEVGDPQEALKAIRVAELKLEALLAANPSDDKIRSELSSILSSEAILLNDSDDREAALEKQIQSIDVYEKLPLNSQERTHTEWRRLLGAKAASEAAAGHLKEAVISYEKAINVPDDLQPDLAPIGFSIENSKDGVVVLGVEDSSPAFEAGMIIGDQIRTVGSLAINQDSDLVKAMKQLSPGKVTVIEILRKGEPVMLAITPVLEGDVIKAMSMYNLGYLFLNRLNEPRKAQVWLTCSVDECRRTLLMLSKDRGEDIRQVQSLLVRAQGELGSCAIRLGDKEMAEKILRRTVVLTRRMVQDNPAMPSYRSINAVYLSNLASQLQDQMEEKISLEREAIENIKLATTGNGNRPEDRMFYFQLLRNLSISLEEKDGPEAAIPLLQAALEVSSNLKDSKLSRSQLDVAEAEVHRSLARYLLDLGRVSEAFVHYESAGTLYESARSSIPIVSEELLEQMANLQGTRIAVSAGLEKVDSEAQAAECLEILCKQLDSREGGPRKNLEVRKYAVIESVSRCYSELAKERAIIARLLAIADNQFIKAKQVAKDLSDVDVSEIGNLEMLIMCARMREDLVKGNGTQAWERLKTYMEEKRIKTLPSIAMLDLATSLLIANKTDDAMMVLRILRDSLSNKKDGIEAKDLKLQLTILRAVGVPAEILQTIEVEILKQHDSESSKPSKD